MTTSATRRDFLKAAGMVAVAPQPRRPNFIVLFADDMGYGDLGCHGHPTIRTSNIDRMASEGTRFTSFYAAASVCTPSRVGLLTGRYPTRAGLPNNLGPESIGGLPLQEVTLAQELKGQGYRTMAIGKWHLGHQPQPYLPTSRGFDSYFGLPYSNDMIPPFVKTGRPLKLYRDTTELEEDLDQRSLTERYTAEAVKFITASARNPFFLYLPYAMPHLPVSATDRFRGKSRAGLYGDVIETLDWSVGEILNTLKKQGVDENTCVVFCSDNGPWHNLPPRMLQKGNEPWHTGTKSLLRGSKGTTYEGGFRVPGVFRWPGRIRVGQVTADMASTLDLFPTFASLAGAPLSGRVMDGFNLMPLLDAGRPTPRREFYYCLGKTLEAAREEQWKCRVTPQGRELYNLDEDPAEQYNVFDRQPDIAQRLLGRMRDFVRQTGAEAPALAG